MGFREQIWIVKLLTKWQNKCIVFLKREVSRFTPLLPQFAHNEMTEINLYFVLKRDAVIIFSHFSLLTILLKSCPAIVAWETLQPMGWEVARHCLPIHTSSSAHSLCTQPWIGFHDVGTHTHTYQVTWPRHPACPGSDWSTSWQILYEPARKKTTVSKRCTILTIIWIYWAQCHMQLWWLQMSARGDRKLHCWPITENIVWKWR